MMAVSISALRKLRLLLLQLRSKYLFDCQCKNMSQIVSAQPAKAEASGKDRKGKLAEQLRQKENFTCQARQRLFIRLLLIYLSTLPTQLQSRRRLYPQILLKCLKEKKFCAKRALGRLFRTPLMSWSKSWTSRDLPANPTRGSCMGSKVLKPRSQDSSKLALRLGQKTSGLFDTGKFLNHHENISVYF